MFLTPMLLAKRELPFDDERYLYEPKIDGHRMIISIEAGHVRLYTRNYFEVTSQYPELQFVPVKENSDVVLDGEVACVDPDTGAIDFNGIQMRFRKKKPLEIMQARVKKPVVFFAFDILRYEGKDLRSLPLVERKKILSLVLTENDHYRRVVTVEGSGKSLFAAIQSKNLEGIVAKRKDSPYVGKRDSRWIKIINYSYANVQIAGYRKNQFGWLLHERERFTGLLELAVPAAHKQAFYGVSKAIVTGEDKNYVFVQPVIQARVKFRGRDGTGLLREPEFVAFVV